MASRRKKPGGHDNGAGEAPKKKSSKLEAVEKELREKEKDLERARETIRALQCSLSLSRCESDETFVHNHNTLVPHSRLKVTPFELLVGWKFRGTFPSLWGKDKDLDRIDVREADAEQKLTSSKHADQARCAMPSDVRVGDRVFLKQQKKTKSDATFGSEKYTVLAQDGSKMVICSENGVQYTRSVNDLKKVPLTTSSAGDPYSDDDLTGDHATKRDENVGSRTGLRNRGSVKKPSRYNDDYIYKISE